jgi:hypothetical protein
MSLHPSSETERPSHVFPTRPTRPIATAPRWLAGAAVWLIAGCASRGATGSAFRMHEFAQAISTGDSTGACLMSYRIIPRSDGPTGDSVRVAWSCTLDLPGSLSPHFVGGNLEFDLSGPDGVVAVGRAFTDRMTFGRSYAFSDTVAVPARHAQSELRPSWRLTCGGKPMSFVKCGPVRSMANRVGEEEEKGTERER